MLRFSDSKLGGISTAYAAQNDDGTVDVKHLEPDTLKILQVILTYQKIDIRRLHIDFNTTKLFFP